MGVLKEALSEYLKNSMVIEQIDNKIQGLEAYPVVNIGDRQSQMLDIEDEQIIDVEIAFLRLQRILAVENFMITKNEIIRIMPDENIHFIQQDENYYKLEIEGQDFFNEGDLTVTII